MGSKTWFLGGVVIVGVVVVWAAVPWFATGSPVETAEVATAPIREFVDERGITRLPKTMLITMPYNGRVAEIDVEIGARVQRGDAVAHIVPLDLELELKAALARVQRLDASIEENKDTSIETTGKLQAEKYVESMVHAVSAAESRVRSGMARKDFAAEQFERKQKLAASAAPGVKSIVTEEELDEAEMQKIETEVDLKQDELVHAALQALHAATVLIPTSIDQYISRKGLQRAVLEQEKAEAQAHLEIVQNNQARGQMRSPIDGVILRREETNERYLSAGTVLLEIGRLEDLEIEADILSQDVVAVELGDTVEIYGAALGSAPAQGRVKQIYPAGFTKISSLGVEQQRVKVIVALEPEELSRLLRDQRLGVGYQVQVRIFTAEKAQAAVVPRSALFRGADNSWQVFAVRDGRARLQTVQVGLLNDEQAEIVEGLELGETVILAPETNLVDGAKVAPIKR